MTDLLDVVDLLGATFVYGPIGMVCGLVFCWAVQKFLGIEL